MAEEPGYVSLLYHSDAASATATHVQRGRDVCKFMEEFWRRYTAIEQAYARGLAALVDHSCASFQPDGFFARMFAPSLEECGELADAWAALRLSMRETAAAHHTIAESLAREVSQPLVHYLDSTEVELRQVTDMGKSQSQELQAQRKSVKALAKQVAKLHVQCAKLKKQSQNQTMAYDKRQKVDLALSTSQAEVKLLEENYKREVQSTRTAQQNIYLTKMPNALFSLQQLEERRIQVVQQSLYKYAAIFQASIPKSRAAVEAVAYATDRVNQKKLVHDFVKGAMLARPEAKAPMAPRYVAFGELDPSTEIVDEEVDDVLFSDMQAKQFMFERMERELMEEMKAAAEAQTTGAERRRRKRSQSSKQQSLMSIPRRGRSASTKSGKDKPLQAVEAQAVTPSVETHSEAAKEKTVSPSEELSPVPVPEEGEASQQTGEVLPGAPGRDAPSTDEQLHAEDSGEKSLTSRAAVSELHMSKSEAALVRKRGSRPSVQPAAGEGVPLSLSTGSCKKEASIGWIDDILSTPAPAKAPAPTIDPFEAAALDQKAPKKKKKKKSSKKSTPAAVDSSSDATESVTDSAMLAKEKEERRRREVEEQLEREREREAREREQQKKEAEEKAKEKLRKKREEKAAAKAAEAAAEEAAAAEAHQRELQKKKEVELVAELDDSAKRMLAELENTVEQNDYYKLFEVEPSAELKHITRMRRDLHKRYHPDNFTGDPAAKSVAISTMMTINEVFTNVFKNPQARELYDKLCLYRAEYANLLKTADPMLQRAATNLSILAKALRKANMPAALNTEVQQVLVIIKKSRGISP